jgi:hypothetical protein
MQKHIEDSKTKRFVHLAIGLLLGATVLTGCNYAPSTPEQFRKAELLCEANDGLQRIEPWNFTVTGAMDVICKNGAVFAAQKPD